MRWGRLSWRPHAYPKHVMSENMDFSARPTTEHPEGNFRTEGDFEWIRRQPLPALALLSLPPPRCPQLGVPDYNARSSSRLEDSGVEQTIGLGDDLVGRCNHLAAARDAIIDRGDSFCDLAATFRERGALNR